MGTATGTVPCGTCVGCLTARAALWSDRCRHESAGWENNCFLTLTYDEEHVPRDGGLVPRHLRDFLNRLRSRVKRSTIPVATDRAHGVRFFACGEYGDMMLRPHYHVLLFNCAFTDLSRASSTLFNSRALDDTWSYGACKVGELTGASANYCAGYTLKSYGKRYVDMDGCELPRPFLRMSNRPGIGQMWASKYINECASGYLIDEGRKVPVPRYYKDYVRTVRPLLAQDMEFALASPRNALRGDRNYPERLAAGEIIRKQVVSRTVRDFH